MYTPTRPDMVVMQVNGGEWEPFKEFELDSGFRFTEDFVTMLFEGGVTFIALDVANLGEQFGNIKFATVDFDVKER
jgi:hypothetical protein